MEEKLPEYADVVVLGTGLPEALLAAACGRAGLSVLHLDRNQYYGGDWSSFTMTMIHEAAENKDCKLSSEEVSKISSTFLKNNEKLIELGDRKVVDDMDIKWIPREMDEVPMQEKLKALGQMRKFSIDLLPKMLLSKGDMVRTLCDSQVSMYAEFKLVDRQLCPSECEKTKKILLNPVPVSKGEIFQSEALTMLEKRNLMKFITFCTLWNGKTKSEQFIVMDGTGDRPFAEFLEMMGVSKKLQEFIIHTIGILDSQPTTASGMKACCEFMNSVGCYGPSPFLFPIYGCGELSQCFCRLAAVFGSIYCLGRPIQALVEEDGKIVAVIADNQRINCRHVIMSSRYVPEDIPLQSSQKFDRIVYATDKPLKKDEKEAMTLVNLAAFRPDSEVSRVVEAGGYMSTAPNGHFLVHATGTQEGSSNVESLVERLFEENEISPYWKMSFTMNSLKFDSSQMGGVSNIVVAPPVDPSIHYANVIDEVLLHFSFSFIFDIF
ncbi:CBN-REP-1 protein [Caenorhabditis brenneri]|uniref:CBN-REP-1 protein n=1 Tax=Caenorhabditis brenneri TaxID=135651 RepID=G0NBU8_CAEBE|nr:CBN-REP-1 protein [Caenorhabditis brenneri]